MTHQLNCPSCGHTAAPEAFTPAPEVNGLDRALASAVGLPSQSEFVGAVDEYTQTSSPANRLGFH